MVLYQLIVTPVVLVLVYQYLMLINLIFEYLISIYPYSILLALRSVFIRAGLSFLRGPSEGRANLRVTLPYRMYAQLHIYSFLIPSHLGLEF